MNLPEIVGASVGWVKKHVTTNSAATLADAVASEITAVGARRNPLTSDYIVSGPTATRKGFTQFSPYGSAAGLNLTLTGAVTAIVMMIAGVKKTISGAKMVTLVDNSLNFVYYDADTDSLVTTVYPCVYSREAPATPASTQPWFDMSTGLMMFYSGSAWVAKNRIQLGTWSAVGAAIESAYYAPGMGWTVRTFIDYFGNGTDGVILYSASNARWEDNAGNALATVGGKWTVTGSTLNLLRPFQFAAIKFQAAATIISGTDGNQNAFRHLIRENLDGFSGAVMRGSYWFSPGSATAGGAAVTTAAAGNAPAATGVAGIEVAGPTQGSGSGGGDSVHIGGHGAYDAPMTGVPGKIYGHSSASIAGVLPAGTTTAGTTGLTSNALTNVSVSWKSLNRAPGEHSVGGGSGALKAAGGANTSGKGSDGVRGGGVMDVVAYGINDVAGFVIHCDGEAAAAASKGVATNAAGDIAGGGGGASGGGGGTCVTLYGPGGLTGAGTLSRVDGGLGGGGGAGEVYNATPSATYNGGNGSPGLAGIGIVDKIV